MNALVRSALRKAVAEAGNQSKAAERLEITRGYMTDLLKGRRTPGPRLLRRLGIRRVRTTAYEPLEREAAG